MTLNHSRSGASSLPPRSDYDTSDLNQLEVNVSSTAQKWAAREVSAAMAIELHKPLTALLLYLGEIKEAGQRAGDEDYSAALTPVMVELALRETKRACRIMRNIGYNIDAMGENADVAINRLGTINSGATVEEANCNVTALLASAKPKRRHLTRREHEVLAQIIGGTSNKEGAYRLGISPRTFEIHRAHIMDKLDARNAVDLVRTALVEGLV